MLDDKLSFSECIVANTIKQQIKMVRLNKSINDSAL